MKRVAFPVLILVSVFLVTISIRSTMKTGQTCEEKSMQIGNPNGAINGNTFSAKNDAETGSTKASESDGNPAEGNSKSTQAVPSAASVETPSEQRTFQASGNDATHVSVTPPDGRIYAGGEEPYAYLPTYSPKTERLPVVPLPGE
jgi:hypothetical protein